MEQGPSWEANSQSNSQKFLCLLWNPEVHYYSQEPATGHFPELGESSLCLPILFL